MWILFLFCASMCFIVAGVYTHLVLAGFEADPGNRWECARGQGSPFFVLSL
jgi:hypothetical protein